jgi:hypothetical protein
MGDTDITYTDLSAVELFQKYSQGSTQFNSVLANSLLSFPGDQEPESTVLTLGSTGDIQFIVRGREEMGKMHVDNDDIFNFSSKSAMWISGNDEDRSVGISRTLFTYDTALGKNKIDAGEHIINDNLEKRNFEFNAKVSEFTGSAQVSGDIIANGHIISRSLNVGFIEDNNVSIGFGFRVTDKKTLELYKFDSESNATQRIATFGEGDVKKNDAFSNFPVFGTSNYNQNDNLTLGDSFAPLWSAQGANIFYDDGKVLIGTEIYTSNPDFRLEVGNKLYVENGIHIGDTGIQIQDNHMKCVQYVEFLNTDITATPIQFDGKLSSLRMDYIDDNDNSTWLRRHQNTILLSSFSNDMNLQNFSSGSGSNSGTWFDNLQTEINLSEFNNDIVSDTFGDISVESINFINNLNMNSNFTGAIHELSGISAFDLSNFNDNIITKDELTVTTLIVNTINSDIIPSSSDSNYDIGSALDRFNTVYTKHLNLGTINDSVLITYDQDKDMLSVDKTILVTGIVLEDGGTITSFGKEGGDFNDFEFIKLKFFNGSNVYNISGTFNFGTSHDKPSSEMYSLYIYNIDSGDAGILLPNESGEIVIESDDLTLVHKQNSKYLDFNMLYEDGTIKGKSLYLAPYNPTSANELMNIQSFIPNTLEFKQKFKADFDYFQNDRMINNPDNRNWSMITPWGYLTGEVNLSEYVNFIKPINNNEESTYKTLVEYVSYYILPTLPVDRTHVILEPYKNTYFIADDMEDRMNGIWFYKEYDDTIQQYIYSQHNNSQLYPKITFKDWKNTANDATFSLNPSYTSVDWYDSNDNILINNFPDEWLKKLLELTMSYIKYGEINRLTEDDQQKVDTKVLNSTDFLIFDNAFGDITINNSIRIKNSIFQIINGNLTIT